MESPKLEEKKPSIDCVLQGEPLLTSFAPISLTKKICDSGGNKLID